MFFLGSVWGRMSRHCRRLYIRAGTAGGFTFFFFKMLCGEGGVWEFYFRRLVTLYIYIYLGSVWGRMSRHCRRLYIRAGTAGGFTFFFFKMRVGKEACGNFFIGGL
jgi:hypothetical protein